jgi:hypothetical protein
MSVLAVISISRCASSSLVSGSLAFEAPAHAPMKGARSRSAHATSTPWIRREFRIAVIGVSGARDWIER